MKGDPVHGEAGLSRPRPKIPPPKSESLLSDIGTYLFHHPRRPTLVPFGLDVEREDYSQRINQRLGINVGRYAILNLHQIGIEAPVSTVFEELLRWNGDSSCWPNHIAMFSRVDDNLESIRLYPLGLERGLLGFEVAPLFNLHAIRFQRAPDPLDSDNARYLLYECSGGYPIGIFAIYVRSAISSLGESEPTQLFMAVGFNFYGREAWSRPSLVQRAWEGVHNRVTSNVLNRFKQLCEWRFQKLQGG